MFTTELRVIIVYKLFCPQLGSTFRAYKDTSTGKQTAPVNFAQRTKVRGNTGSRLPAKYVAQDISAQLKLKKTTDVTPVARCHIINIITVTTTISKKRKHMLTDCCHRRQHPLCRQHHLNDRTPTSTTPSGHLARMHAVRLKPIDWNSSCSPQPLCPLRLPRGWQPAQPNSTARTPLPPFSFGPPVPVPVPRQPRLSQPALHSIGTAHYIT